MMTAVCHATTVACRNGAQFPKMIGDSRELHALLPRHASAKFYDRISLMEVHSHRGKPQSSSRWTAAVTVGHRRPAPGTRARAHVQDYNRIGHDPRHSATRASQLHLTGINP
jgi:hypothetical protein